MNLLSRTIAALKGGEPTVPPHVQEAIDVIATNDQATEEATIAVEAYWRATRPKTNGTGDRTEAEIIEDYRRAEEDRRRQA